MRCSRALFYRWTGEVEGGVTADAATKGRDRDGDGVAASGSGSKAGGEKPCAPRLFEWQKRTGTERAGDSESAGWKQKFAWKSHSTIEHNSSTKHGRESARHEENV